MISILFEVDSLYGSRRIFEFCWVKSIAPLFGIATRTNITSDALCKSSNTMIKRLLRGVATKILYTDTVYFTTYDCGSFHSFTSPIVIHPNKMYEILFGTRACTSNYYHDYAWKSEVELDEKITIKLHRNPSEDNSERRGLVSSLGFNRV